MIRTIRKLFFYPLLLAFAAGGCVWFFSMPYRPERLFRAVPAGARLLSVHRGLGARWDTLAAHPLVVRAAELNGLAPGEWQKFATDPETRRWLQRLGSDELVLTRFEMPRGGRSAWGLATWIGGASPRFRWLLAAGRVPGMVKFGDYCGRPLWLVRSRLLPPGRHLAVAVEEGLLFACLSEDANDLCQMLDAYDGAAPSCADSASLLGTAAPDRGWLDLGRGPGPDRIDFELDRVDAAGIAGRARLSGWDEPLPPAAGKLDVSSLDSVLGARPDAVALLDPAWLRRLAEPALRSAWGVQLRHLLDMQGTGAVAFGLYGDARSGRFKGVRVPGLTAAVRLKDPAAFEPALADVLDRLNAHYQWGLICGPSPFAPGLRVFESTANETAYSGFPTGERVACAVTNGWLVLGSNFETLRGLLAPTNAPAAAGAGAADWRPRGDEASGAGLVWLDLDRASRTLRLALAVYTLRLLLADADGSAAQRERINLWKDYLDALPPLRTARIRVTGSGTTVGLRFRLGD